MGLLERVTRDVRGLALSAQLVRRLGALKADGEFTVPDALGETIRRVPQRVAIRFEERAVTYAALDAHANRYADWARAQGVARGDVVALLMENRPEYVFAWLGLAKLGVTTALINSNLVGAPLAHSLRISRARHLVLGAELAESYASAAGQLESAPRVWATGGGIAGAEDLDAALASATSAPPDASVRRGLRANANLFYVYTSGTTGLPKAANFSHHRFLATATGFTVVSGMTERDCIYIPLPLYHTAGGVAAAGPALLTGGAIALTRKFSASRFWSDCVRHEATVFQYIGELCRYLLATPERPEDQRHRVRVAVGNGLRPEVWPAFQERFRIPRIVEFYGATEGNLSLVNFDGKPGAVGRVPRVLRKLQGIRIARFDVEREEVVRGADGLCIECAPGESGELLGKISERSLVRFEGYSDAKATEKKILRDVFERGDSYFRTGDLLRTDTEGYYYFVDRIGDTFRWKGENVATSEVAEVLSSFPGVREANVYGVSVPGHDGRAGMAALVADDALDLAGLYAHAQRQLAAYARPLFLRMQPAIEITGTFKHRKIELVKDGFDPARIGDPLYFADAEQKRYVPLDAALFARIAASELRL